MSYPMVSYIWLAIFIILPRLKVAMSLPLLFCINYCDGTSGRLSMYSHDPLFAIPCLIGVSWRQWVISGTNADYPVVTAQPHVNARPLKDCMVVTEHQASLYPYSAHYGLTKNENYIPSQMDMESVKMCYGFRYLLILHGRHTMTQVSFIRSNSNLR